MNKQTKEKSLKRKILQQSSTEQQNNKINKALPKQNAPNIVLDTNQIRTWSKQHLCSLLCDETLGPDLAVPIGKLFYDANFDGTVFECIVNNLLTKGKDCAYQEFRDVVGESIGNKYLLRIIAWINSKLITNNSILEIPLLSFNIISWIQPELDELPSLFRESVIKWSESIAKTIQEQQKTLRCLYRTPLLPDHHHGFSMKVQWTNHFNAFPIPKDKGKELIDLLSNGSMVEKGTDLGYSSIALIDLSTSGKTYTIFQLANSKPTSASYSSFFVINLVIGTFLFEEFLKTVDEKKYSPADSVSLLALTINICVSTLVDKVPSISSMDFLRFVRHVGDLFLSNLFFKLAAHYNPKKDNLNIEITKKLTEKGVKVVFSFDEAHILLKHVKNSVMVDGELKGSLFHAVYQEIRQFNNPVFVGTTFNITDAILQVSNSPVIGSLQPWLIPEVDQALSHLFNVDDVKQEKREEYDMLCYLLSGAPEYVTMLHRQLMLNNTIGDSRVRIKNKIVTLQHATTPLSDSKAGAKSKLVALKHALKTVINFQEERAESRLKYYLLETRLVDRKTHLLKLLFNKECVFQKEEIMELEYPYTYSQAFIENTIAHVVKTRSGSQIFDIVDPIIAKNLFEHAFEIMVEDMWQFMSDHFNGNGEEFELFMVMLLLHESKSLNGKSFTSSPLFESYGSLSENWCLNMKSLLNDRNLKNALENNSAVWLAQLAHTYFRDSFVRPNHEMAPDGIFYLQHCEKKKSRLVTCAISLISDPNNDQKHPHKAVNLLESLCLLNVGHETSCSITNNTIGWIVAPNMDSTVFNEEKLKNLAHTPTSQIVLESIRQGSMKLFVTDRQAIDKCLSQYKNEKYFNNMEIVWKKFQ